MPVTTQSQSKHSSPRYPNLIREQEATRPDEIHMVRQAVRGAEATRVTYRRLVDTARASVRQAKQVLDALRQKTSASAQRLCQELERFLPRLQQGITQTVRRVFEGQTLPPQQKLVSLFEPHTATNYQAGQGRPRDRVRAQARAG